MILDLDTHRLQHGKGINTLAGLPPYITNEALIDTLDQEVIGWGILSHTHKIEGSQVINQSQNFIHAALLWLIHL